MSFQGQGSPLKTARSQSPPYLPWAQGKTLPLGSMAGWITSLIQKRGSPTSVFRRLRCWCLQSSSTGCSESGLLKAEPTHRHHMWSRIPQALNALGCCQQDVVGPEAQVGRPVCCCVERAGSTPEGASWPRLWPQLWLTPMEWAVARMFLCQALLPEGFYLELPIGSLPARPPVWPVERWPHLSCLACTFLLGDPACLFSSLSSLLL